MKVSAEKIRNARKYSGLTQKQLSEKTGIPQITIRKYEDGTFTPKIEKLLLIANALNLPLFYFTDDYAGSIEEAAEYKVNASAERNIESIIEDLVKEIINADSFSSIEAGGMREWLFYRYVTDKGIYVFDHSDMELLMEIVKSVVEAFMKQRLIPESEYIRLVKERGIPFYLYNSDQK